MKMFQKLIDFFNSLFPRPPKIQTDSEAIASDWEAVGQDIWKAVRDFHSENQDKIEAHVRKVGIEVFGSEKLFDIWFSVPTVYVGNVKPSEAIKTPEGLELVIKELGAIEHGIFA